MIEVAFYKNGYEINGHARPDICGEVSIFAWAISNIIQNIGGGGDYYTSVYDNSDAGYGHLVFNTENDKANEIFNLTKQMLPIWADHYNWQKDNHIKVIEKDETLVISPNFKVLKGIVTTEQPSETAAV
jgi:hypothetical protein